MDTKKEQTRLRKQRQRERDKQRDILSSVTSERDTKTEQRDILPGHSGVRYNYSKDWYK